MVKYAAAYGGFPDLALPWTMFIRMVALCSRVEARLRYRLAIATAVGYTGSEETLQAWAREGFPDDPAYQLIRQNG